MLGGAWMLRNSLCSCQKLWEMWFPETTQIVRDQNRSSNLFLGSEPYVWALAWLGEREENDTGFTMVRPIGHTST